MWNVMPIGTAKPDCSKLYKYGTGPSILGKWYAKMNSGMGYRKSYEFVPKVVYSTPSGLNLEYTERTRKLTITWDYKNNMGFTDSTLLEVRIDGGKADSAKIMRVRTKLHTHTTKFSPKCFQTGNLHVPGAQRRHGRQGTYVGRGTALVGGS